MDFDSRYTVIKEVGAGTFGVVRLVKQNDEGTFFACKEVGDVADILVGIREADVMTRIRGLHPNIVSIKDHNISITGDRYKIKQVMEYCAGGNLEELLREESNNPDKGIKFTIGSVSNRLENLLNVINVLTTLQNEGIYHMDVKTENILYRTCEKEKRKGPEMCLCDFSNYYLETPWKGNLTPPAGPIEAIIYRPPEVGTLTHKREFYDRIDVWAMGVVIAETMGSWGLVQNIDIKVGNSVSGMKNIMDKLQLLRNNRKNGKKDKYPHPLRSFFPGWFFRDETLGYGKLGTGFSSSSLENEMVHSLFFAREFSSKEFREAALHEAVEYFTIRKGLDSSSLHILNRVYNEVLPLCFKVRPRERATMKDISNLISDILELPRYAPGVKKTPVVRDFDFVSNAEWNKTVEVFFEESRNIQVLYGRLEKRSFPVETLYYAKRLAEEYMVARPEKTTPDEYMDILCASVFLASELMDFVFPYENCNLFNGPRTLESICPYIKRISDTLMGTLGVLSMREEERRDVFSGEPNITIS
jgi:serine/threonine protein kinase